MKNLLYKVFFKSFNAAKNSKKHVLLPAVAVIFGSVFMISAKNNKAILEVTPLQQSEYNTILLDVGDVLLSTSPAVQRSLFFPIILKNPSLIYHVIRTDTKALYFDILSKIPAQSQQPIYNKNTALPLIMADWMNGYKTPAVLRMLAYQQIQKTTCVTAVKRLLSAIANFMFDPEALIQAQEPNCAMIKLMHMLREKNYKVYLLSNWDPASFEIAQKRFPEIFENVDGMIISGKENLSKPDPKFFQTAFSKLHIDPRKAIFIDDEPHNVDTAKTMGLQTITHTSPTNTIKELMRCGVLTLVKN